ncbi:GNAT family N-acetyltransferase [Jannaschia ovalis]|uniref:GNAT family N-acetyltransferase n=1 Tax=Jannaschia ovalis TaxID=3038773 RepID=A0ABY8LCP0_9RHOB|nr:GNAT family N-acetyltransferase [Jannaschia sp. GRR-S6-38]WGH79090.1 GNAT family N-acetyltransferase [Jannaschia sp. GRR-S6-38]
MTGWTVRRGGAADAVALARIFWRAVHEGAAPRYDAAQRAAWLPAPPAPAAFADRLAPQAVVVADGRDDPIGFMTLGPSGHLDPAYVLPEWRGTGLADALLAVLLNHAATAGLTRLTTRASDMARPFFARHGWQVVAPAPRIRAGVVLPATDMAFDLPPARPADGMSQTGALDFSPHALNQSL